MSGGRPKGSESWYHNPATVAAREMQREEIAWLARNPDRRYLPAQVKLELAKRALARVTYWDSDGFVGWARGTKMPTIEQVLRVRRGLDRHGSRLKKVAWG